MSESPLRLFLRWLLDRQDIVLYTVYIEYNKKGRDANPILLKFGHEESLNEIEKEIEKNKGKDNELDKNTIS